MVKFVGLKTGARLSEILGITKDDISFEADTINIDKTWDYKGDEDGRFKKTKNQSSIREVLVDKETTDLLKLYIEWLDEFGIDTESNTLFNVKNRNFHSTTINNSLKEC